jgi:AcrR family transcriptional regulator
MRKLARLLDMSLGNLQYHFPTRTAVLDGILVSDIAGYREIFDSLVRENKGGRELLYEVLLRALSDAGHQDEIAVFRALSSFNEPEIIAALRRYYQELYRLLENGLAELAVSSQSGESGASSQRSKSSPSSPIRATPDAIQRAASLLFPYLDGYETTKAYLPLGPAAIAELLTDAVLAILAESHEANCATKDEPGIVRYPR